MRTYASVARFALSAPKRFSHLHRVKKARLTYLSYSRLIHLSRVVRRLEQQTVPGIFVETGCALGGSAIVISLNKAQQRPFHIYDTFGLIPPPSSHDADDAQERYEAIRRGCAKGIAEDTYYGYQENLLEKVVQTFHAFDLPPEDHRIHFHQGLFADVLQVDQPVALAHIDSDWYDSITVCLARVVPHVSLKGVIVIDDYYDWEGARRAVDDFFVGRKDRFRFDYGGHLRITRIA
jgi:asparagine synthase (glutamine-hydrolysing)